MEQVVIVSGVRTPIGSFLGSLSSLSAPQLGSIAIRAALEKACVDPAEVDEVLMGCVLSAGLGQAPARQASLGAGIPESVPCTTINKVCGSGMKTVMLGALEIMAGQAEIVVAGGMESMSQAPYLLPKAREGYRLGHQKVLDSMILDGLWDPYGDAHMGSCGDACSSGAGISREELDAYAAESYRRARSAQDDGFFANEIAPVSVPQRKGDALVVAEDEEPRKGDPSKFASLRPAFGKDGVTTAANASTLNDGAAALVLASATAAERRSLHPLARILAQASFAHAPSEFPSAPIGAVELLLKKAGLEASQIDLFEINEAFSVVPLLFQKALGVPSEKLNVHGGAVSLGHPIGMTGARLVLTAAHALARGGGRFAIASPCIGGGEATAVLLEAI